MVLHASAVTATDRCGTHLDVLVGRVLVLGLHPTAAAAGVLVTTHDARHRNRRRAPHPLQQGGHPRHLGKVGIGRPLSGLLLLLAHPHQLLAQAGLVATRSALNPSPLPPSNEKV